MFHRISHNVKIYLLSNSFYYGGFDIINAFLSVLITSKVTGGRLDMVGYVLAFYMFTRVLLEIPISKFTSRYSQNGKKNIVSLSYLIYGFMIAALGFSTSIWHIFALQATIAILDATAYPLKWTIFSEIIDKDNEEFEWGLEDVFSTLITAIFAGIGGIVSEHFGLTSLFVIFGILFSASGYAFYFIRLSALKR